MIPRRPIFKLSTHEVSNAPPHLGSQDLWQNDTVLQKPSSVKGLQRRWVIWLNLVSFRLGLGQG